MKICKKAKRKQNMTVGQIERWTNTQAYRDYRKYRDGQKYQGYTRNVVERAKSVARGTATKSQCEKVYSYLSRAKRINSGKRKFGKGRRKVSANTAALRNWGYDPT
ncbi:MAG: hypothetical protein ABEK36_01195 [Candidatus Aenigmatarchaeota archaeon]